MNRTRIIFALLVPVLVSALLQREFARGTFDPAERAFVGWLAANTGAGTALPPLTLVLYDEESSALAGLQRMGTLDAALFARAASRLGASAAGAEGLPGDPGRMIEAAGRMPLFAGYSAGAAPGAGWTPWAGAPDGRWPELPGLVGPSSTRLPRGFFSLPEGSSGPRMVALAARNSDRTIPSFLSLCWAAAQRDRTPVPSADRGWLKSGKRRLPVDSRGAAFFFPAAPARVMSMNEFLVFAEKYEREGGVSPLRGNVVVLARATAEIARVAATPDNIAATPAELWAQSWSALRQGRFFLLPGWWYAGVLVAATAGISLRLASGRHGWSATLGTATAVLLVYLLAALGAFASSGLLLPFVPSTGTLIAGIFLGRFFARA